MIYLFRSWFFCRIWKPAIREGNRGWAPGNQFIRIAARRTRGSDTTWGISYSTTGWNYQDVSQTVYIQSKQYSKVRCYVMEIKLRLWRTSLSPAMNVVWICMLPNLILWLSMIVLFAKLLYWCIQWFCSMRQTLEVLSEHDEALTKKLELTKQKSQEKRYRFVCSKWSPHYVRIMSLSRPIGTYWYTIIRVVRILVRIKENFWSSMKINGLIIRKFMTCFQM